MDDFWVGRLNDNRIKGLLREVEEALEDCNDPDLLHKLIGSFRLGFANLAARRERELRTSMRTDGVKHENP